MSHEGLRKTLCLSLSLVSFAATFPVAFGASGVSTTHGNYRVAVLDMEADVVDHSSRPNRGLFPQTGQKTASDRWRVRIKSLDQQVRWWVRDNQNTMSSLVVPGVATALAIAISKTVEGEKKKEIGLPPAFPSVPPPQN